MSSQKLLLCPGTTSKEYILQDEIQKGPYSTTYRAKHKKSQKPVILEVVPFDKINHIVKFNQFFEHQKMILRKCKHQNIIKLLQIFKSQSAQILVFENCNGGTLEDLIRHLKTLTENHAAYILSQILKAFKQLRKINAMHRDFKTQHIYFHNDIVKIGNFSLSKVQNSPNSTTDTSLGTAFTMAPQVLRGDDYQANADIWSIGTVCYKMIFGNYPFRGKDDEQILINMETQRPDYKGGTISQQCQDFIDKCLQIDPKQRFQWQTIFDHPFIKSFETRDFRQFKIKYALQRLQQLQKEFQLQRTQLQNQIKQLQAKLKQQKQNSKRKQKDIQFYRNEYQKQKKKIRTLEKVIKDKNEEIEHYRKLLSNKQQETKQKQKLSETLYSKIKQYMNKLNQYVPIQSILGCVNTKTPLTIKNQQKTPQSLSNISKKTDTINIYLFDEQNYKQIQEMKNNFQKMKEKLSRYEHQSDQILRKRKGSQTTNNTDTYQSTTNASQIPEGMKETDTEIEKKKPQQLKAKSTLINSKQLKSQKPKDFFSVYNAFNKNKLSCQNQQPQTIDELTKELKIKLQKQQIKALQQKIEPKGSQQKKITKLQQQTFKGDNLYFEKSILQNKVQQLQQIIKLIQKDSKISSSTLIYKKSNNDKDLAHKINKIFSKNTIRGFLILVETINNNKFGIYCNKNNTSYKVILMNINSPKEIMNINSPQKIKFFYPRKQTKQIGYLYRLMSHRIWLGGKQIKITNKQPELQFDFDVEGDRYFEIQTIQQLTGSKDKHLNFKEIQVFDIRFQQ